MDFLILVQDLHLEYLPNPLNTLDVYEMSFASSPLSTWLGALYGPLIANMLLALAHCAVVNVLASTVNLKSMHPKQQ